MIRSKARIFFPQIIIWSRLYDSENGETEWPRTLTQSKLSGMSDKFFAKHVTLFYSSTGNQTFIFQFLKIENKLYKEDFITLLHKKRGAVNFFVGGLFFFFFVTKKEFSVIPIFWYLDQDVTTMAQINCLLSYKAFTFQLFPHYTNGKWCLTFLLVLAKNHLHSSFLWWSADQRRDRRPYKIY